MAEVEASDPPLAGQLGAARAHPAMAFFEGVGGSAWPDDRPVHPRLLYHCVARLRRGGEVAYLWFERPYWWVQPWRSLRRPPGLVERFESLATALDCLVAPALTASRRRSWWPWGRRAEPGAADARAAHGLSVDNAARRPGI
jgi:hypothetical protein